MPVSVLSLLLYVLHFNDYTRPIEDLWDVMKPMDKKKCINIMGFFVWVAAMNAFTDLLVYLWPIQYLWAVQMPKGKRIGLIACFGVGVMYVIIASSTL